MTPPALPRIDPNSARIDGLVARAAPVAVLFRRGPSKRVRLLRWDLATDEIEPGQWFKGRVYARRCDLSPDGSLLCYFAASWKQPYETWTAISHPPWFTALALWPKGDAWGGGGLFQARKHLLLNHRFAPYREKTETELAEGFRLPASLRISPLHDRSGWGEDDPIESMRLGRDGWNWDRSPIAAREDYGGPLFVTYDPPVTRRRSLPPVHKGLPATLRVKTHAIGEKQGRWYVETADLVGENGAIIRDLGRVDWAELDHDGDVLFASEGRLFRLPRKAIERDDEPKLVADLNDMAFEAIEAPNAARRW